MLLMGKRLIKGKGQLMITTRRRLLIFSPANLLIKIGAVSCALMALIYSASLGLKVRRSEAAVARIGTVTNFYMEKNAAQAEKSRQIRLFVNTFINKSYSNSESVIAEHRALRILKRPYPSIRDVEKRLGDADEREFSDKSTHLKWNHVTWHKPQGWSGDRMDWTCPSIKSEVMDAWFDGSGRLLRLAIFLESEEDGSRIVEYIGRQPEDWRMENLFSTVNQSRGSASVTEQ
jgi:hypothetical protein